VRLAPRVTRGVGWWSGDYAPGADEDTLLDMTTAQMSATAHYLPQVKGIDLSLEEFNKLVADNIKGGRAYGLVCEGLLEIQVLGRAVVPVLRGYVPGLSLSALFGSPKVTIRCGSCGISSKSAVEPLSINGVTQKSSLIFCDHCGTANIANIYLH